MKHVTHPNIWSRKSTLVAVGYLVAAGALLGVVGASVAGPDPAAHAESIERKTAAELSTVAESLAAVRSVVGKSARANPARLRAALDTLASWNGRHVADLPDLPRGVSAAIISGVGEIELELGAFDLASPSLLSASLADGRKIAVAPEPIAAGEGFPAEFAPTAPAGTGLYVIDASGKMAETLAARPRPDAPLATPVSAGSMRTASGSLKQGRLVTTRTAIGSTGLTAVAERFLTPNELSGAGGASAAYAVAGLGLLLSLAFCNALAVMLRREDQTDAVPPRNERAPLRVPNASLIAPETARPAEALELSADEGFVFGRSIMTLRDALGAGKSGPDLAACARSPILRALSRQVRHASPTDSVDELGKAA